MKTNLNEFNNTIRTSFNEGFSFAELSKGQIIAWEDSYNVMKKSLSKSKNKHNF